MFTCLSSCTCMFILMYMYVYMYMYMYERVNLSWRYCIGQMSFSIYYMPNSSSKPTHYTAKEITDVRQLTNILDVRLVSVCSPFAVRCIGRRMFLCTFCALEHYCTNGWRIMWTSVCCPFVQERLTNISDDCLLSVCAQTVGRYIGRKRKRKFNEDQENNTFGECKQLSQEKIHTLDSKWTANCCPMF